VEIKERYLAVFLLTFMLDIFLKFFDPGSTGFFSRAETILE